ncbi:hypothetical protein L6164_011501 [Bauhinia variegata]|uniref:Uncharacterized protein n=1 Tax=Bauhinia variegata TaxID=167791 RepID=A0ACB9P8G7_BAUVA|nr:hypothetical protein L6164_011501 [Bauhinia variegata]
MIMEVQRANLVDEHGATDPFPVGMRVLAVDDDPICLKVLENLLRKCHYQVTTTNQAIKALDMLREDTDKFDLVISDVNMPDMDGFKLLELVGLEMDLPVIMLSAHSDKKLVMKGVTHGACDYLLKPVRIEELKNIWQHVIRRKNFHVKNLNKALNENVCNMAGEGNQGIISESNADRNKNFGKRQKDLTEDEEEDGEENGQENDDPSTQKKPRVVWSVELHRKFVAAVNQLGLEKAFPKKILDLMNVEGLTRENVASHLQKYRLYLKKATKQANLVAALGTNDSPYLRMGSLEGFRDFRTFSGPGRLSSITLSSYASNGMFSRLNSPAGLNLRGINSSGLSGLAQSQNMSNSINTAGSQQPSVFPANQSSSLFQGVPSSVELNQSQQSNCTIDIGQISPIDDTNGFPVATSFPDSRVAIGSPSNYIMLQGNSQHTCNSGAFRNQSSLRDASLNSESFDIGVGCSSDLLDYSRCNERWLDAGQLSKFPANPLPLSETFNNDQLPPSSLNIPSTSPRIGNTNNLVDFSSASAIAIPLEDARGPQGLIGNVVQPSSYTSQQRWEEHGQDYNPNMNRTFNSMNPLLPSNGFTSSSVQSFNQNNAISGKRVDPFLIGQLSHRTEFEKFSSDAKKSSDTYILEQRKSQDGFIQNKLGSLDDIMSSMVKREQNEMILMDGEMGFDAYPIGSCI